MGSHSGPVRVYVRPALRWLTPLIEPRTITTAWVVTAVATISEKFLIFVNVDAAVAVAGAVVLLWAILLTVRSTTRFIVVADRYHVEIADKASAIIVKNLPKTTDLSRAEVLAMTREARWELACLLDDQGRLTELKRLAHNSVTGLAPDDPLRDELAERENLLDAQLRSIQTEFEHRLQRLEKLASHSAALATEAGAGERMRAAAKRARSALKRTDSGLAETTAWDTRVDPTTNLSERTEAILSAYLELTNEQPDPLH
jgi:hypothetical protein